MNNEHPTPFEDVIDALMLAESEPSHEVLSRWTARYPEHRDALARFFAAWAVQEATEAAAPLDTARSGQRMVSQALDLLHRKKVAAAQAAPAPRLSEVIKKRGLSTDDLAARCGIDDSILVKLDRKRINLSSIPRVLVQRLAAALDTALEEIQASLAGGPVPMGAHKALRRVELKTEDFLDAVDSSDLGDAAKAEWKRVVAEEQTPGGSA